ncbi:MAG: nitrogenase component 1 [Lacrimispora sp.]|uniref:nitrogenase component 1 n=1 Tax=Lacrimispora sp. TaxID=2719234 RepID=UPI0039E5B705
MKELQHLKKLSAVKSNTAIKFLSPAVSPGCHCPMRMAALTAKDIRGLSSLLVGMPECTTHVRLFNPKPEGKDGELHWLYVLDQHEVVFGCRAGVMDALRKMDQDGAKAILLIATCIPELIGEDMESVIQEVQPELSAPVTHVMLGQFKNFSYPPGYWKTMEALASLMKPQQTNPVQINVLGRSPREKHIPMPSLFPELERRGVSLRYLAPGASLTDFQSAPDAAMNLVVSPYTQPLAVRMEREFRVPFISLHTLFSVEAIDRTYGEIAKQFGFTWGNEFDEERERALSLEEKAAGRLNGLRYIASLRVGMPLALAGYLAGFGMEPLLLHMDEFYPEDKGHAKALLALGHAPYICRMVNLPAEYPILERLAPDICFGYLRPGSETIPNMENMHQLYGKAGYGLTIELLEQTMEVVDKSGISGKGGDVYGTASV